MAEGLAHDESGEERPAPTSLTDSLRALGRDVDAALSEGALRCGPFLLLEELGEGGYGVVYAALQDKPVERRVAVKLLKLGLGARDVLRRFELEQRALARIDHPGVASIIGAGITAEGRPWFAMPLIDGDAITNVCDDGGVNLRQRVTLLAAACDGLQAAHVQGILHRDLKPGNILVTTLPDGTLAPKIIDFGLAKALSSEDDDDRTMTLPSRAIGTPAYMAPEQLDPIAPRADVRADVYALGVVLAELISGLHPARDRALHTPVMPVSELCRADQQQCDDWASQRGLPGARSLRRVLTGDLEAIVAKATMPEPARRYQSADALANDLRRYLGGLPVTARTPGALYAFTKFVARNRAATVAAALGVVTALALTVLALSAAERATTNARLANDQARQAMQLNGLLRDTLARVDPDSLRGRDTALVQEMLDGAARRVQGQAEQLDPAVVAAMAQVLREAYRQIDRPASAVDNARVLSAALQARLERSRDPVQRRRLAMGVGGTTVALGDAEFDSDVLRRDAIPQFANRSAAYTAWRKALDALEAENALESDAGVRARLRLWNQRTTWRNGQDESVIAQDEDWIAQRLHLLSDELDRWGFRLRRVELAEFCAILSSHPQLVAEFAASFGADHPAVIRARVRGVSFHCGAALESQLKDVPQHGIPYLRCEELAAFWRETAALSSAVVADAVRVFGERHSVTMRARLWDLTAQGHAYGADHARPLYDALADDLALTLDQTLDQTQGRCRQLEATWSGINGDPAEAVWWSTQSLD